jgi:hypothetical protein
MAHKNTKRHNIYQNFLLQGLPIIDQNWYFWFENISSGNPDPTDDYFPIRTKSEIFILGSRCSSNT